MNYAPELQELVLSMSAQEKRYFKQRATAHTRERENTYTKMFDVVTRYAAKSPRELHAVLAASVAVRNLPAAKNKLAELILDSLAEFHAARSLSTRIRRMLDHAEVLYNKGLYRHCRKVLQRARSKAEAGEKHHLLSEIHFWEWKLLFRNIEDTLESELRENSTAAQKAAEQVRLIALYREQLGLTHALLRRNPHSRTDRDREALRAIIGHELLSTMPTGFSPRLSYLKIHSFYAWSLGNFAQAMEYYERTMRHWETQPLQIRESPDAYAGDLANYLTCCIAVKNFDHFTTTLAKIQALPVHSRDAEIQRIERVDLLELSYCLNFGLLDAGLVAAERIGRGLRRHGERIAPNRRINLRINCGVLYFLLERYGAALEQVHAVMHESREALRRDIQQLVRVFRLVLHWELGDYEMLENLFRSTTDYLKKHDTLYPFERVVISGMKSLCGASDESEHLRVFRTLQGELLALLHENETTEPPGLIELLFWLEAKVSRQAVAQVYRARLGNAAHPDKRRLFPA